MGGTAWVAVGTAADETGVDLGGIASDVGDTARIGAVSFLVPTPVVLSAPSRRCCRRVPGDGGSVDSLLTFRSSWLLSKLELPGVARVWLAALRDGE